MYHDPDDEFQSETVRFKLLVIAVIAVIVCGVISFRELRYAFSGRVIDAAVERAYVHTVHGGRAPDYDELVVMYTIDEPGPSAPNSPTMYTRHEADEVDPDWYARHPGDASPAMFPPRTVRIEYLPMAEGCSRLVGHSHRWTMFPFIIALAFIGGVATYWGRDYAAYQRRLARGR